MRHTRHDQLEKSAVVEHSISIGHHVDFNICVFDMASGYMECLFQIAIQVRLSRKS